ncbi:MAG: sugar ABC transporter ATP-binding protein [Planctomycetia bacterium]|nr:sugar ABC transporter ATP-binding protein [Planctomycetia bacterium]
MRGVHKSFPGVHALDGVDLELLRGEVLALVGENGAGKSTLIKVLSGAHRPDAGTIEIAGRRPLIRTPLDALRAGVAVIYQEFNLVPAMSARENLFLGRERTWAGLLRHRRERREARRLFRRLGIAVDPDAACRDLPVAGQQAVEIAKALSCSARLVVMDEPSATLTTREVEQLFAVIGRLKRRGIGVIYVTHRLEEVFAIADRVTVLRDGRHVATQPTAELSRERLIELMVGRRLENEFPKRSVQRGEPRLRVEGLRRGDRVRDVSFQVRRGEVLALTGLVGAGRTETARLVFGADVADRGTIVLDGRTLSIRCPRDAIRAGICLLTEDRKSQGLVLGLSVRENFGLPNLPQFASFGFVRRPRERMALVRFVDDLQIKTPHFEQPVRNLSGGNQQKVVLAKWLQQNAKVILFDEPTRGIDVGAKYEIYRLINDLAARGMAIVMISSELPEVLGMSDRILVMHEGRITGEITDVARATQEQIMDLAVA